MVHGTMADPKWLDATLDPNGRKPGWCFLGEPEVVNNSPIGIARFTSLRSWLSQWSYDLSNADGVRCAPHVTIPALVLANSCDDAVTPEDSQAMSQALGSQDKTEVVIEGANHYYFGQPEKLAEAVAACGSWLEAKGFD